MSAIDPRYEQRFNDLGISNVKSLVDQWSGSMQHQAREWIADEERRAREREEAHMTEQLAIARSAKDEAAIANALAHESNKIANESNTIARAASTSAAKSASSARLNNMISTLALFVAIIALVISAIR